MKPNKTPRQRPAISSALRTTRPNGEKDATQKTHVADKIINRLAGVAQIGTLALAIFGYFYTVVPVFQNQKLQEDNAKLQMENDAEREKLKQLGLEQEKIRQNTLNLQVELDKKNADLATAVKNASEAIERERRAKVEANESTLRLRTEIKNLSDARWTIALTSFETNTSFEILRQGWNFSSDLYKDEDQKSGEFITKAKNLWPNPHAIISAGLDLTIKKNVSIPKAYFQRIQSIIDRDSQKLTCQPLNLEKLRSSYQEEAKKVEKDAIELAHRELERQVDEAKKSGKKLLVSPEYEAAYINSERISGYFSLESKYRDQIFNRKKLCDSIVTDFLRSTHEEIARHPN